MTDASQTVQTQQTIKAADVGTVPGATAPAPPPAPQSKIYTVYQLANGRICGKLKTTGTASAASPTTGELEGDYDPARYYVDIKANPPVATLRPPLSVTVDKLAITANGTDSATFGGVPVGATVTIDNGPAQAVTDGEVVFNATVAGTYAITFRFFPNEDANFNVVAS